MEEIVDPNDVPELAAEGLFPFRIQMALEAQVTELFHQFNFEFH
jgi:hypothetical protein